MNAEAAQPIRAAQPADWPAIEALLIGAGLPLAGAQAHLGDFLVARRGGEIVACVGLECYGEIALMRSCAVAAAHRGGGMGSAMTRAAIELAGRRGASQLLLLTTTADQFFPRFGFKRMARDAAPAALNASAELQGACPASASLFSLAIPPA